MDNFESHINKTIDGRYKIQNVVGVGGMAYVLKANDLLNDRTVALKILSEEFNNDQNAVKRFINESRAISMLHHNNIVTVYDVAITDDLKYIVMEYVDGITLKDYMSKKAVLNWREAVDYTIQILEGLSHAHLKGVIHRDIKPQNIMLKLDGTIKITDFGIAKIATNENLTMTDKAIGTVNYISPEQASGAPVTTASDLYAVGVMLYEMTTGVLPFLSESPVAVATMHVSSKPVPPREKNPNIPVGLEQIILKVMNKNPKSRFSSADNMIKALMYLLENPNTVFSSRQAADEEKLAEDKKKPESEGDKKEKLTKSGKVRGSRSMFPIVSGFTLAFLLICGVFSYRAYVILDARNNNDYASIENKGEKKLWEIIDSVFIGSDSTSKEITIPSLVGKLYNPELELQLNKDNFRISKIRYVTEPDKEVNVIVAQSPEANAIRKLSGKNSAYDIILTINKETETVKIPDLSLMSYNAARAMLIDLGISKNSIEKEEQYDDSVVEGYVISSAPKRGETFDATGDAKIKLYISAGQKVEIVAVPELVGLSAEVAKRTIIENKLSIGSVTFEDSSKPKGTVIRASLEKDAIVPEKITKIDLFVSLGNLPGGESIDSETRIGDYIVDENGHFIYSPPADTEEEPENEDTDETEGQPQDGDTEIPEEDPEGSGITLEDLQ